ncbi:hypothetical protein A2Z22_02690 [Candidatus Woesebacteria bacterium RBG_16_34_12]|uniref:Glycosyltransferase RgtA/B/C/D-like domain-containing protein n=1 Tax=Candidatus Woesebacteria bacterium RBG_16_34_12 TaxID=1802480 RepID=A0A1F7X6R2_9BACT|nr:MAG: hypothetical protein A2Z22_02690 [Candidatus Woesebacteria bacterium RBG_16_34_12]
MRKKRKSDIKKFFKKVLPFAFLLIVFILTRRNSFNIPFERDEGEYAYVAWRMGKGELPYQDIFTQKPPAIFYVYMFAQRIDAEAYWPPRLLATLSIALTFI